MDVIEKVFEPLFWRLPWNVRRGICKLLKSESYQEVQQLRNTQVNQYSLKPFDRHRCIFVHIPKTGGVSVCMSLFGSLAGGHSNVRKYKIIFSKDEFCSYFKFTFVRNPWDRLVSAFTFLKSGGLNKADAEWACEHLSAYENFDSFVRGWVNRENIYKQRHFIPQYEFLRGRDIKPEVDFIGYFKNFEEDFKLVTQRLDMDCDLKHLNKTKSGEIDYKDYYSEDTIKIVADAYREDIELFGYDFENRSIKLSKP